MAHASAAPIDVTEHCKSCFMCRHICTSARITNTEQHTPRGRSLILSMLKRDTIPYSRELAASIFSCCLCAHCRTSCASHLDFPAAAIAARAELMRRGLAPQELMAVRQRLVQTDSPYDPTDTDQELAAVVAALPRSAPDLLLLGPGARQRRPRAALAAIRALQKLGLELTVLPEEPSSAYLLHELGAAGESAAKHASLVNAIAACNASRVICLDPRTYFWTSTEKNMSLAPAGVVHFIELIAEQAALLKPVLGDTPFSYHDPDYLARWADLCSSTRAILHALGKNYTEPYWKGPEARSLGGFLLERFMPGFARDMVLARMNDFTEANTALILTACCDDCARLEPLAAAKGIACTHIAEVIAEALS